MYLIVISYHNLIIDRCRRSINLRIEKNFKMIAGDSN